MKPGTDVKVIKGDHKGKKGRIGSNRPANSLQQGKIPVQVGNKNQLIWVRAAWLEIQQTEESHEESREGTPPSPQSPVPSPQSPTSDLEKQILQYLASRSLPRSEGEIAIALDTSMLEVGMALKQLEQRGKVCGNGEGYFHLPKFYAGQYITDGSRTGLITSEDKGIFTVTFVDTENELQCTIEDLRENFTICGNQLELLDSLKVSADSVEQPNSSADLSGSSQSKSITMLSKSSQDTSTTTSTTETSETTIPPQEQPTSTPLASPAITQATQEIEQDYSETNQDSGWMRSVVLLKDYLNSSLSSSQKESFIEACEQSLGDLEWQDTLGITRSCYRQLVLEQRNAAPDFLQLPTLTALDGKNSRPGGLTKCDKAARKLGIITNSQLLSVEMMALISGYPTEWTKCLSGLNLKPSQDDCNQESSTAEQSSPSRQSFHLSELNTSTLSPGKQWLDPQRITLKGGTQYRHYIDEIYAANPQVVQQYAEMMQAGLWEWEREPLPVAFLSADGKIYAGDCHHRVSAALAAGKEIFIDLRPGELVDAQLHSCQSNVDHGYQLRPKDQRKRIEYFLDILESLDPARSRQLLDSIPGLTEIERRNVEAEGRWSARVIAKHLRLTESGYRTVINIQQERSMIVNFAQRFAGYCGYVELTADCDGRRPAFGDRGNGEVIPAGTVGKLIDFNEKKGAYVGIGEYGFYVHPKDIKKTTAPPIEDAGKNSQTEQEPPTQPTSVKEEIKQQAASLGLTNSSIQLLPDVKREPEPQQQQPVTGDMSTWVKNLPQEEFQKVWIAVTAREEIPDSANEMRSHLEKCSDEKLKSLIFWADTILKARQEELKSAS